jgi:hypothetical protein
MAVVIRCPFCKTKFRWLAETEAYPKDCPECGEYVGHDRADDDVSVPNILAFSTRCTDGVYKMEERMSAERAEMAAQAAGVSVSDMSSLKVTNMKDGMREGDIAAMPVVNDVTRQMDAVNSRGGAFGFGGGPEAGLGYSAQVGTGAVPNAGARTQRLFRQAHAERMAGHMGGIGGGVLSDLPANEITQNPGYRPRV